MHDLARHRRLMTFAAHNSGRVYDIAGTFVDRLAGVFPAARGMLPMGSKTERFDTGYGIAEAVKNLSNFDRGLPVMERVARRLKARGFSAAHVPAARSAFLNALRSHAGETWSAEIERDWAATFDVFVGRMDLAPADRMRMAA